MDGILNQRNRNEPTRPEENLTENKTMKYRVKRYWIVWDEVEVEIEDGGKGFESRRRAIAKAHKLPLSSSEKQEYLADSINSDPDSDVTILIPLRMAPDGG